MLQNNNLKYYYEVGSTRFVNKFCAFLESKKTGYPLKFNLYEDAFDKVSWKDPELSWDALLDIRAHQIAAKNKPIVLNFSGGTDSYTILKVFERCKIKLHAIHLKIKTGDPEEELNYRTVINWLKENYYDIDCKIYVSEDNVDLLNSYYNSPDWVWRPDGSKINFSSGLSEVVSLNETEFVQDNLSDDYIMITGLEKPRIKIIDGKFYSYQIDSAFGYVMGESRVEHFYISDALPELHVKQSHLLVSYIRSLAYSSKKPLELYEDLHDPRKFDYYNYSYMGCGRFGDIANSRLQKIVNIKSKLLVKDSTVVGYNGRYKNMFMHGFKHNESFFENYIAGLVNLRNDNVLKEIFLDDLNLYSVKDLNSKLYLLEF